MTVAVLGSTDDLHARRALDALAARGEDAALVDARDFPSRTRIAFDPARPGDATLALPGRAPLAFAAIRAVYFRIYDGVAPPHLPDSDQARLAANDARGLFETFLLALPHARWVNTFGAVRLHRTKPLQLAIVARLGVPIPATVVANDADAVRRFAAAHPRCIFKPVQGGAHAERLDPRLLEGDALARLAAAPVTVQEEIAGTNVRVFVAGERVMACEVRTREVDFRDDPSPEIVRTTVPDDVAAWCVAAARALDLAWTGIDVRRTPEGRHVFLEANPSPMFLGFEQATGLPLTEALVELLVGA